MACFVQNGNPILFIFHKENWIVQNKEMLFICKLSAKTCICHSFSLLIARLCWRSYRKCFVVLVLWELKDGNKLMVHLLQKCQRESQWVFKHSEEFQNRRHFPSIAAICRFPNILQRLTKTFCCTWMVGCQKLAQYIRMLYPGRFILIESVFTEQIFDSRQFMRN